MSLQRLLLLLLKPIVKFFANLFIRFEKPKISGKHYYHLVKILRPGDIILSSSNGEVGSNLINPSEIKHGCIYIGEEYDKVHYVTEAVSEGVVKNDLVTFLTTKDRVIVLRPSFNFSKNRIIRSALSRVGYGYDYEFESGDRQYYCFEHIALCYESYNLEIHKSKTLGYQYYSSDSFLLDVDNFDLIFDSEDNLLWEI